MIKRPTTKEFILPVEHRVQLDNTGGDGYRECFLTSCTMLADYCLDGQLTHQAMQEGLAEPEDVFAKRLARYGDTTNWSAQIRALGDFGIEAYASRSASLNDVAHSLFCGVPVVLGTAYKSSGHIVLAVGRRSNGFVILCPNGIRRGATSNWVQKFYSEEEAKPDIFSWALLKQVFTDMGAEAGWALFVTTVNGTPTGVRRGL